MRGQLVEAGRRRAARIWTFRAGVEQQAAARFARLGERLLELDADPSVTALAQRAARDEHRHHELCTSLVAELGGASPSSTAEAPGAVTLGRRCPHERLLAEVVAMSCVTESLSAALLVEMRRRATDERVREVVHEVLRDEIDHARLGWAHLAVESTRRDVGWLAPHLPAMLTATVHEELFGEDEPEPELAGVVEGLGSLRRSTRRELFVGTMESVVFPGLQRFGVDPTAGRRWLRARLGSAQRSLSQVSREVGQRLGQR